MKRWTPSAAMPRDTWTVIYDGECRFCRATMTRLRRWDHDHRIVPLNLHAPERAQRFPDLAIERLHGALHAVNAEGRTFAGVDAFSRIGSVLPGWRWVAWLLRVPGIHAVAAVVYNWVARNRHRWNHNPCDGNACARRSQP